MARARSPTRTSSTDRARAARIRQGYARIGGMAKGKRQLVEVRCPCCEATLQIDPELKAVISYEEHKKPPSIEDIGAAVQKLKGEEARRDEVFQKSFAQHKS